MSSPKGKTPAVAMWNARYTDSHASYGTVANAFLRAVACTIPSGPVLVIGAGEGRNAVYLAEQGYEVTAMDQSAVGLSNASELAAERGVTITTEVGDLADYDLGEFKWSGIVSIWTHVPPALRAQVHARCVRALKPGGVMVLEAYAPAHLDSPGRGGPPVAALLFGPETAREEFRGLTFTLCQSVTRHVAEGRYHVGLSATTQVLGVRPAD